MSHISKFKLSTPFFANNQSGTAITEFLIGAPILLFMLLIAFDLNDILESRQNMRIAVRNQAFLPKGSANAETTANQDMVSASTPLTVQTKTESVDSPMGDRIKATRAPVGGADSYTNISKVVGSVTAPAQTAVQFLKNMNIAGVGLFIPDFLRVSKIEAQTQKSNAIQRAMTLISDAASLRATGNKTHKEGDYNLFATRMIGSAATRPEAGFHPADYQWQAIPGFIFGTVLTEYKHWGTPYKREGGMRFNNSNDGYFLPDCMMHFSGKDNCKEENWLSLVLRTSYAAKGIVTLIERIFDGGSLTAGAQVAYESAKTVIVQTVGNVLEKEFESRVSEEAKKVVNTSFIDTVFSSSEKSSSGKDMTNPLQP